MARINLEERGPQLNLAAIESFERRIGRKLPDQYCRFLLDTNGGKPELNYLATKNSEVSCGVVRFYSILDRTDQYDLLTEQIRLKSRMPRNLLIIADCAGGNRLCISVRAEDFGSIFFWDHELTVKGDPSSGLFLVAPDFAAFFDALVRLDPATVDLQPDQITEAWIDPDFLDEVKKSH